MPKKLRIAVDLTSLSYHITGIERYALCVTEHLINIDRSNEYILIFKDEVYKNFKDKIDDSRIKAIVLNGKNKLWFLQVTLCKCLKKVDADKYLFFAFTSPYFFKHKGIINTVHDMGAWDVADSMKKSQNIYWKITINRSVKCSEKIITVSQFTKNRLSAILHIPSKKIHVINSAVTDDFLDRPGADFQIIKKKYNLPDKYIVSLSTLEPRKNFKLLLDAYTQIQEKLDYELVLIGRKGWKIENLLSKYKDSSRVHFTGFVNDSEVKTLYSNALCFVFPTIYEGFGLPPVEALACGTPVISSNAASMPEVLMDRAIYFKNNDIADLQDKLIKLCDNVNSYPHSLNDFQKKNYNFSSSAYKVLELLA